MAATAAPGGLTREQLDAFYRNQLKPVGTPQTMEELREHERIWRPDTVQATPPINPVDRARNAVTDTDWYRSLKPEGQELVTGGMDMLEYPAAPLRGAYDMGTGIAKGDVGQAALGALDALPEVGKFAKAGAGGLAMMLGPKAKNADLGMMAKAQKLMESGASPQEIWDKTGWFQGAEGGWRFEISDKNSYVKGHGDTLRETYEHPELFENYPQMLDIDTAVKPTGGTLKGSYHPGDPPSGLVPEITYQAPNAAEARSTLLHEMQHGVQAIEGFNKGGNTVGLKPNTPAWNIYQERLKAITTPLSLEDYAKQAWGGDIEGAKQDYDRYVRDTKNALNPKSVGTFPAEKLDRAAQESAVHEAYRRMGGEVEARNVQTRRNFDDLDSWENPPWETEDIPRSQQLITLNKRYDDPQALESRRAPASGDRLVAPGGGEVTVPRREPKPPTSTTEFGGKTWQPERGTIQGDNPEYTEVLADVKKVDADFAKDRNMYVGPGGEGQIKTRYPDFGKWHGENPDVPVIMPRVGLTDAPDSRFAFGNGRHRFAYMRDQGVEAIPMTVNRENAELFKERYGYTPPQAGDRLTAPGGGEVTVPTSEGPPRSGRMTPQQAQLMKMKREYQSDAPRTHPNDWTYKLADEPGPTLDPVKDFDPNELRVGDAFIPLLGDKSRVSAPMTQVGPYEFSKPVSMLGGPDFARGQAAWASNGTIPQTIHNKADRVAQAGGRPIGVTVGMGAHGINYSHHTYEPLIRMTESSGIRSPDIREFDKEFRAKHPGWPGLKNEDEAIDFLRRQDTTARNPFVALHQSKEFQNKGFPEAGPVRWAATEPDLRQVIDPATGRPMHGPTGYNFVQMDPSRPVTPGTHSSYASDIPKAEGGYLGRAPLMPYDQFFRDWGQSERATRFSPSQASHKAYTFSRDQPTQVIDQQMIDELGKIYEQRKRGR